MENYELTFEDDGRNAMVPPPMVRPRPRLTPFGRRPVVYGYYPAPRPVYVQPREKRIAGMTTAELIELGAKVYAAIQPLPTAPTGQGCVETDLENLVIYQTALASHAKRDEQVRTLGELVAKALR